MNSQKNAGGILWHEHWFVPASSPPPSGGINLLKNASGILWHILRSRRPPGLSVQLTAELLAVRCPSNVRMDGRQACPSMRPPSGLIAQKAAGRCRFQTAPTNRDAQKMRHPRFVHNMFPSAMEWTVCPYSAAIGS